MRPDKSAVVRVAAPTERRSPRSAGLDLLPTLDVLRLIALGGALSA